MDNFSPYHCTSERHLARLTGNGASLTLAIYGFAFHLSGKSGVFFASIPRLAAYFEADEKTVRKALRLLAKSGFLEEIDAPEGKTVRYKPVSHLDWQKKRGGAANCIRDGRCVEKPEGKPYEEMGKLGQRLYAISGGDYRPYPNFIKGMRNTGHSDEAIERHFRDYLDANDVPNWKHGFQKDFMAYLREQEIENGASAKALATNKAPAAALRPSVKPAVSAPALAKSPGETQWLGRIEDYLDR